MLVSNDLLKIIVRQGKSRSLIRKPFLIYTNFWQCPRASDLKEFCLMFVLILQSFTSRSQLNSKVISLDHYIGLVNEMEEEEKKDVEELREVLSIIRSEVPGLLKDLIGPLKELMSLSVTPEEARERAKSIAAFYNELIEQGFPADLALELTRENFVNPTSILKEIFSSGMRREERIKRKVWEEEEE